MEGPIDNPTTPSTLSRVEAVVSSMDDTFAELQLAGSYETVKWPRSSLTGDINIGEKILLEIKNHPLTSIQKVVEKTKQRHGNKDPAEQRKLLENLIN
jgi:hypothetical protein